MVDLKYIFKQKGYTISEVANSIGISQSALSQQINNESIKLKTLCEIADALSCPLTDLLQDTDDTSITLTCPHCKHAIRLQVINQD